MTRILLLLAVLAAVPAAAQEITPAGTRLLADIPLLSPLLQVQAFDCAETTCGQIRSCDEACYKLMVYGHQRRDGDGDGIPCEDLCSRRC